MPTSNAAARRVAFRDEIKRLVLNFPQADFAKTEASAGREMARELDRMIGEDTARAKRPAPATLQGRARIAELIFLLRDQPGTATDDAGVSGFRVRVGAVRRGATGVRVREDSPVRQLINSGPAAVPQLIEALDDTRMTRAVHYYRAGLPTQVLRVGDCALQILEAISGQRFTSVAAPLHTLSKNERKTLKNNVNAGGNTLEGKINTSHFAINATDVTTDPVASSAAASQPNMSRIGSCTSRSKLRA